MLRPWRHRSAETQPWASVDLFEDGEGLFRLGDVSWRRTTGFPTPIARFPHLADLHVHHIAHLTLAQRHKCENLYVQLAGQDSLGLDVECHIVLDGHVGIDHVLRAFATVHLDYAADGGRTAAEELGRAARSWWQQLTRFNWKGSDEDRASCIIKKEDWLPTCSALLAALPAVELPSWMLAPHIQQFKLAARHCDAMQLTCEEFVAWRTAVQRFTPNQIERVTRMAAWTQTPRLEDLFRAADSTKTGMLSLSDVEHLVERWWTSSDPHCETVVFGL